MWNNLKMDLYRMVRQKSFYISMTVMLLLYLWLTTAVGLQNNTPFATFHQGKDTLVDFLYYFPKSSFYESTLWQVIGPLDFTISDIIGFLVGSIIMVLLMSGVLYVIFKVFKGTGTFKQLVADMLLTLCINSWIHLALALIIIPTTVLLNVSAQSNSYGLNYLEWINVIIMALLMAKQFNLSPWLTGIVYYFISFVIAIIQLAFSGII